MSKRRCKGPAGYRGRGGQGVQGFRLEGVRGKGPAGYKGRGGGQGGQGVQGFRLEGQGAHGLQGRGGRGGRGSVHRQSGEGLRIWAAQVGRKNEASIAGTGRKRHHAGRGRKRE